MADGLRADRRPFVLATVVRAERPTSAKAGDSALLRDDGTMDGFVGGSCAESTVRLEGLRVLSRGDSLLLRITPDPDDGTERGEGCLTVANPCLSGGSLEIFLESVLPAPLIRVFGDAPVARALGEIGRAAGYDVSVIERPADDLGRRLSSDTAAVVVASHGRDEEAVLVAALRAGVPYVALVASPRRGSAVVGGLPVGEQDRARVHSPAGLDLGARTPADIAITILAELIAERPGPGTFGAPAPDQVGAASPPANRTTASGGHRAPAEVLDPVCGMAVATAAGAVQATHLGRTRYFCGTGCRSAFLADPQRYDADG
jgi:xanthine dehydrogenase accessory factor